MILFSDFIKIMPLLKHGFYVNWNGKQSGIFVEWYSYKNFVSKYDFKKIQVIECKRHFNYSEDFDFELILRRLT